jgi:hypothetical protein
VNLSRLIVLSVSQAFGSADGAAGVGSGAAAGAVVVFAGFAGAVAAGAVV